MDLSTLIFAVTLIALSLFGDKILAYLVQCEDRQTPEPEQYPISYPMEPMFINFASIRDEISECENEVDLNRAYIRILIFEGCYSDSLNFTSELIEYYQQRQFVLFS